jgi:hypothetical protein
MFVIQLIKRNDSLSSMQWRGATARERDLGARVGDAHPFPARCMPELAANAWLTGQG